MTLISATIICLNEEKKIRQCIESIINVVDEVIIVDSFSKDSTKSICLEYDKVKFFEQKFLGYIEQKNFAISKASYDYVFSLDSDEALSESLQEKILTLRTSGLKADGYIFNRVTNYSGQWIKHCGWYPDKKLRLFNKQVGSWAGINPHDKVKLQSENTIHIPHDILHYSYDSIKDHVSQTNNFSSIASKAAYENGKRTTILNIISRTLFQFPRDYFLKRGFLDGFYGFVICWINTLAVFLKYTKIYEIQKNENIL